MIKKIIGFIYGFFVFYYFYATIGYIITSFVHWNFELGHIYYLYAFWVTPSELIVFPKSLLIMFSILFGGIGGAVISGRIE